MLLGCIADDFTGATDLANMLVRGGMRTVQTIGLPKPGQPIDADAVVVALKSRTIEPKAAVAESLAACRWLRAAGAKQIFFKYCSTFDSTERGNIGPVAEALMDELGARFTIACPAFPENGRSIFRGHLFVADALLSESGMEKHPLTPMTDANLVRVLQSQSTRSVGLARYDSVAKGAAALSARFAQLQAEGIGMAIVDALSDADLRTIGQACADFDLITGGSGVAIGLPDNFVRRGLLQHTVAAATLEHPKGLSLVISGSCSRATQAQVAHWQRTRPSLRIDPLALDSGEPVVERAVQWLNEHLPQGAALVYATSSPEEVQRVQTALGVAHAGHLVEQALANIAQAGIRQGVRRLVVAGGETSGAVVQSLGIARLRIGAQIDPGVPWTLAQADDAPAISLALKSGNFGTEDFFTKALAMLPA
ncbi:MAG: hypothetical protein RI906_1800 [Pseudomonadota bacterium]|jgi:uncharacterized protein YgbK (DUF1537 family)